MGNYIFLSKDTETMEQTLRVLTRIQQFYINDELGRMWLVCEDWDWLAILQWLQDNGLFKNNPKRPPLKAFENWLNENNVPHVRAHYTAYEMSLAHRRIGGARYPWNDVNVDLGMIRRWRIMYYQLSRLLSGQIEDKADKGTTAK